MTSQSKHLALMSKPKGGLGRGLSSLIGPQAGSVPPATAAALTPSPTTAGAPEASDTLDVSLNVHEGDLKIRYVSPAEITENSQQPRSVFDDEALSDLQASILEHGILQPLVVVELGSGKYELIAGERRLRASRALGLEKIPVVVRPPADEQRKLELALIENIQRQDLNALEEARAYQVLIETFGLRQEDVAGRVGKSRSAIANTLRLLDLDPEMLNALAEGKISRSHARTLLAEPVPSKRRDLFEQMLSGGLTVRQAEAKAGGTKRKSVAQAKDPNLAALEAQLREALGTKVTIDMQGGTGKVIVHFYSREDLKELIDKFNGRVS